MHPTGHLVGNGGRGNIVSPAPWEAEVTLYRLAEDFFEVL